MRIRGSNCTIVRVEVGAEIVDRGAEIADRGAVITSIFCP